MAFYFYIVLALVAICRADDSSKAAPASASRSAQCISRNGYYKVDGSCDSYVECVDYIAEEKTCPDGLHYNPAAAWPSYPCGYPMDVPCAGRGAPQDAQPTADCPHQYGFFPLAENSADCGQYRMCVAGRAFNRRCAVGLAFNPATGRCDWPDQVPSCDAALFLGFTCPAPPLDANGKPLDIVLNYKYESKNPSSSSCFYFFSCEQGRARLLQCDDGMVFNPSVGRCVDDSAYDCKH